MSRRVIEGSCARLCGIRDSCRVGLHALPSSVGGDYAGILNDLRSAVDDKFSGFDLTEDMIYSRGNIITNYEYTSLLSKINQLIRYLELIHGAASKIIEIGSIYNLIKDTELKSRCADLLSAHEHFDRVINQATQVLEDRVRQKSPRLDGMTGLSLMSRSINPEVSKTVLIFSDTASEQEGYANLFKGMIGAFRNPSHHVFLADVTREQALQICVFVDNMLTALDVATVANS